MERSGSRVSPNPTVFRVGKTNLSLDMFFFSHLFTPRWTHLVAIGLFLGTEGLQVAGRCCLLFVLGWEQTLRKAGGLGAAVLGWLSGQVG